jgi:hypothetical protein
MGPIMRTLLLTALAAAASLAAGAAGAATFSYSTDFAAGVGPEWSIAGAGVNSHDAGILGQLDNGVATLTRSSVGDGAGTLAFDLLGFRTIDGFNCCTDTFHLRVNGTEVFNGVFNLGGGGGEGFAGPPGTTVSAIAGGRRITLGFTAGTGANTFAFDYGPLQGFGDEAWGLDNVGFTADVREPRSGGAPEPAAWAMLLLGFGGVGAVIRRRRAAWAAA